MKKYILYLIVTISIVLPLSSQNVNRIDEDGNVSESSFRGKSQRDSTKTKDKIIPKGLKTWTIDEIFGDRTFVEPDTVSYLFMNTAFTTGLQGEYNTTGNLGSPRENRIFVNRKSKKEFIFTNNLSFFMKPLEEYHFTNTLSPLTNLSYNSCGNKTNGEDHFAAKFAVNLGKKTGLGFSLNYLYGRGYYQNQNTSSFNYSMYASHIADKYQAHLVFSLNHIKHNENGGIVNDTYITNPELFNESYSENEIPTQLSRNWNRNDNQQILFSHRVNVGFNKKIPMTPEEIEARRFAIKALKEKEEKEKIDKARRKAQKEGRDFDEEEFKEQMYYGGRPDNEKVSNEELKDDYVKNNRIKVDGKEAADSLLNIKTNNDTNEEWMKNEYVPVTSFIHTLKFENYKHIYQAYQTPENFYNNTYYNINGYGGDSIYDVTKYYSIKNTLAIALLENFNKWVKSGLKIYASHEFKHFTLPDINDLNTNINKHSLNIGGELSKKEGRIFHYSIIGETGVAGYTLGNLDIIANADVNFKLFGDTVRLVANVFFTKQRPQLLFNTFHSKHLWWENDLSSIIHSRIKGELQLEKTKTKLMFAMDNIKNYTYFSQMNNITQEGLIQKLEVKPMQNKDNINIITASLSQSFKFGIVNFDTQITYQQSSSESIPLPKLNLYANLFLRFKIAKVLDCDLGADIRYFTKYYAPEYSPIISQFTIQENKDVRTEIGNYPFINVYANFKLKQARFFVMMSHVNAGSGNKNYFLVPHYPMNTRVINFGVSWNFHN